MDKITNREWEYFFLVSRSIRNKNKFTGGLDVPLLWTEKDKDGNTTFESISKLGKQGWEMVNAVPITDDKGQTLQILFTFKRAV